MIRINVCLVRASEFFRQFCLVVKYKPGKKHIIPDVLSRLASANNTIYNNEYSELNHLFVYHITLVEINSDLIKRILDENTANSWWVKVHKQVLENKELGPDKAILPFVIADSLSSNSYPYF